jgi:hypothetical protein
VGEERLVVVSAPFEDGLNGRKLVSFTDSDWTGLSGRLLRGLWT